MDTTEYLKQFEQPWKKPFFERAARLPAPLREALLNWEKGRRQDKDPDDVLAELLPSGDAGLRRTIAEVFFPNFPDVAERTLDALMGRHPYTLGYARRAFRQGGPELQAKRAADWAWAVFHATKEYPQDIQWFAVHAGLLNAWQTRELGLLLGQAISDGDEQVFQILKDTASTQHPVARMGRHVPLALLSSTREDAWELAEKLLLAAQRQEGLRQVILETVDEASLDAFTRLLRLILKEDLLRFAATLRAACVWFGLAYDVENLKVVRGLLTQALGYLENEDSARQAVRQGSGVDAYLALYCLAMRDAMQTAELARPLLQDAHPERRMAAVQFLQAAGMLGEHEQAALLHDADLRLASLAGQRVNRWATEASQGFTFEEYVAYAQRLPDDAKSEPLLFPWMGHIQGRQDAMDNLMGLLGNDHITKLAPYLSQMSSYGKSNVLSKLKDRLEKKTEVLDSATRDMLLALLQDRNSGVSQAAVDVMAQGNLQPTADEIEVIHTLLRRKSADLRRGLIRLLAKDRALGEQSAVALLGNSNTEQRQAGLQLLAEVGAQPPADFKPKNVSEATLLAKLTEPDSQLSLKDGLGLFNPADLTQPKAIQARERDCPQDLQRGAVLLRSLDALLQANRETPLVGVGYDGEQTLLLGNVSGWMLRPNNEGVMPLGDLWDNWFTSRQGAQDGDLTRMRWALGHFVARKDTTETELQDELDPDTADLDDAEMQERQEALNAAQARQEFLERTIKRTLGPLVSLWLEHADLLRPIVGYLTGKYGTALDTDLQLDAWETALSYLPLDAEIIKDPRYTWREEDPRMIILHQLKPDVDLGRWTPEQFQHYWQVSLHHNQAFPNLPRLRMNTTTLLHAYRAGLANRSDLLDQLIGDRPHERYNNPFDDLHLYTRRKLRENTPNYPDWMQAVSDVRDRVLEVELTRGDLETPATLPAQSLQSVNGAALTLRLLAGMGKNPLKRGHSWNNTSKDVTFSHLLRVSFPAQTDTPALFARLAKEYALPDTRLLDLAMFAPQWANLISETVGWKGLQDGVYWLHAHTKDSNWSVPQEIRDAWEAEITERTPLSASDLTEGAVDVAWFKTTYKALGKERFHTLLDAAKYASSSGGHKRAELFARAILGELDETELRTRIKDKRNQDAVRAIGLLPLSKAKAKAAKDLESRYRLLMEFRKEAKQWGAQKQASERLAADIGMQNLARTAGFTDPQRLMWAMEARMAPDWRQKVEADGLTLSIALTRDGEASLVMQRGEKAIKTLPPALKKNPAVIGIREAVKELEATRKRMRAALEEAMVRGDHFQPQELRDLAGHPVIAPMLRSLLWVLNEQHVGWWQGDTIQTIDGDVAVQEYALRIAHPHDLYTSGHWPKFQQHIMVEGITQPFKQAFREYYPLTNAEQDARRSSRYAGHHVQPGKAAALFKTRGWITVPEEGVRKTFHAEGINVWVDTAVGYGTPNEVEGAAMNAVYFIRRDQNEPMPLAEVPPRLLSETMRDLDLVVSVAHVGGVDPEASLSTVEMRTDLLRETLRLLKLKNVRLENNHALIDGHYAKYTIHLGSGTVHRQPGGFLCVIPVHNQHQGRIFLPFADPDPKTAEVISKALLLAEDKKIQDPTILEQLR